jgi:acetyl esterase/lipase
VHTPEEVARLRAALLADQVAAVPTPPRRVASRFEIREREVSGIRVHEVRPRGTAPLRTVVYVHGGGFVSGLDRFHWRYAARLAERLDVAVLLPSYPLTPTHTYKDALPPLVDLFNQAAVESPRGTVLMGDSAGGGLALLLAQTLARGSGPQPTHLVMFSPWLDLTCTTPGTKDAARTDPWLDLTKARLYGTWWGAGDPPHREASPLDNDLTGLPPALLLCGSRDLLRPQSRALVARAPGARFDLTYVEEPGLMHVYPLLPIPEARRAFDAVAAFL